MRDRERRGDGENEGDRERSAAKEVKKIRIEGEKKK